MRITSLNNFAGKINFYSNINFIPVKSRKDAKKIAQLYTDMHTYRAPECNKPINILLENITKALDTYTSTKIFHYSVKSNLHHHMELVEKDNELIGAYSLDYTNNNPIAYVDFMVETPQIRQKRISKDFLLAVAERICDIANSNNIKAIRWRANLRNPRASNLYKKRIINADTQMDLLTNSLIYTVDVAALKKSIDAYKGKH